MISNSSTFVFNPNTKYLFNRQYSIAIGSPKQTTALQYANFPFFQNGKQQKESPIRISFEVSKNIVGTPNKAKISLYNLTPESRQKFKKGDVVLLKAGYVNLIETIFVGNISAFGGIKTERHGPDIVTIIECEDGGSAIVMATLHKSYPPGTTLVQILQDLGTAMNITSEGNPIGIDAGVAVGIPNITYGRGITVEGTCKETLDKLLANSGHKWSIQNGNLVIVPTNGYNGSTAVLVSEATGMIGTPSQNDPYTEFQSLLNPKLVPNCLVKLESEDVAISGFYKVLGVHHEGDSHEVKWQVKCQCTRVTNIVQNLPVQAAFSPTISAGVV